jgi:hypothetical protein
MQTSSGGPGAAFQSTHLAGRLLTVVRIQCLKVDFWLSHSVQYCSLGLTMKMIAEYLEHALSFERMAADENNPQIKGVFEKQAASYRKLIASRTKKLGMDDPRYLAARKDG